MNGYNTSKNGVIINNIGLESSVKSQYKSQQQGFLTFLGAKLRKSVFNSLASRKKNIFSKGNIMIHHHCHITIKHFMKIRYFYRFQ